MCGIVGAVSTRNIVPILVQGLQRLWNTAAMTPAVWRCTPPALMRRATARPRAACSAPAAPPAWPNCWNK